jgi:hypothetical protein
MKADHRLTKRARRSQSVEFWFATFRVPAIPFGKQPKKAFRCRSRQLEQRRDGSFHGLALSGAALAGVRINAGLELVRLAVVGHGCHQAGDGAP